MIGPAGFMAAPKAKKPTCECPARCKYCGAKRRRDIVGHYCPTNNCDWQHGYSTCTLYRFDEAGSVEK